MSLATFREVVCPSCGDGRDVSDRHHRRLAATPDADLRCGDCRNPREHEPGNAEILFWLEWAGVVLTPDADGRAYVLEFGMPPRLSRLLASLNGSVRYLP